MAFENSDLTRLYDLCYNIAQNYRNELTSKNHVASGQLSQFRYEVEYNDTTFVLKYVLPMYWYYVEKGRQPTRQGQGGVLYPAILQWIGEKNIVPTARHGVVPSREQLAHMITKSIHRKGFPAYHPLHDAMVKSEPLIEELEATIAELMADEIRIEIQSLGKTTTVH